LGWGGCRWNGLHTLGLFIRLACGLLMLDLFSQSSWHGLGFKNSQKEEALIKGMIDLNLLRFGNWLISWWDHSVKAGSTPVLFSEKLTLQSQQGYFWYKIFVRGQLEYRCPNSIHEVVWNIILVDFCRFDNMLTFFWSNPCPAENWDQEL
jgi:hypothetical protein